MGPGHSPNVITPAGVETYPEQSSIQEGHVSVGGRAQAPSQGNLQHTAFWAFFFVYLAPVYLFTACLWTSANLHFPGSFSHFMVWLLANQEDTLGYIYRLATAAVAISIPFAMQHLSWRIIGSFFALLLVTLLVSAIVGALLRRGDMQDLLQADDFFEVPQALSQEEKSHLVTIYISSLVAYFSQVQQTIVMVIGTMTGIKISGGR